ncbi:hypothetical protein NIES22_73170 (plasmid) [Calothrix brevissima NIES-22]|nr:hypothetical protein NIES22_73170 [Calothrix brevissima NIES-22]
MESTDGGAIEDASRPHGEYQSSSDQLQSARDSLERFKSNVAATARAIEELNQSLQLLEQYLPKPHREVDCTIERGIEPDEDYDIEPSIEPQRRRGFGR